MRSITRSFILFLASQVFLARDVAALPLNWALFEELRAVALALTQVSKIEESTFYGLGGSPDQVLRVLKRLRPDSSVRSIAATSLQLVELNEFSEDALLASRPGLAEAITTASRERNRRPVLIDFVSEGISLYVATELLRRFTGEIPLPWQAVGLVTEPYQGHHYFNQLPPGVYHEIRLGSQLCEALENEQLKIFRTTGRQFRHRPVEDLSTTAVDLFDFALTLYLDPAHEQYRNRLRVSPGSEVEDHVRAVRNWDTLSPDARRIAGERIFTAFHSQELLLPVLQPLILALLESSIDLRIGRGEVTLVASLLDQVQQRVESASLFELASFRQELSRSLSLDKLSGVAEMSERARGFLDSEFFRDESAAFLRFALEALIERQSGAMRFRDLARSPSLMALAFEESRLSDRARKGLEGLTAAEWREGVFLLNPSMRLKVSLFLEESLSRRAGSREEFLQLIEELHCSPGFPILAQKAASLRGP